MQAADMLPAVYDGHFLRRWSLVGGYPRCVLPPLDTTTAPPALIATVDAENLRLRDLLMEIEAYEAEPSRPITAEAAMILEDRQVPVDEPAVLMLVSGDGEVVDFAVADEGYVAPAGLATFPIVPGAAIGGTYVGGIYTPPPPAAKPAAPEIVSARQARLALLRAGLLDAVETAVAGMSAEVRLTWEYAVEIRRDDPLLVNLATMLGLTEAQIDDLFLLAASL